MRKDSILQQYYYTKLPKKKNGGPEDPYHPITNPTGYKLSLSDIEAIAKRKEEEALAAQRGPQVGSYNKAYDVQRKRAAQEYSKNKAQRNSALVKTLGSFTPSGNNQDAGLTGAELFVNANPLVTGPIMSTSRLYAAGRSMFDPKTQNPYFDNSNSVVENILGGIGLLGDIAMLRTSLRSPKYVPNTPSSLKPTPTLRPSGVDLAPYVDLSDIINKRGLVTPGYRSSLDVGPYWNNRKFRNQSLRFLQKESADEASAARLKLIKDAEKFKRNVIDVDDVSQSPSILYRNVDQLVKEANIRNAFSSKTSRADTGSPMADAIIGFFKNNFALTDTEAADLLHGYNPTNPFTNWSDARINSALEILKRQRLASGLMSPTSDPMINVGASKLPRFGFYSSAEKDPLKSLSQEVSRNLKNSDNALIFREEPWWGDDWKLLAGEMRSSIKKRGLDPNKKDDVLKFAKEFEKEQIERSLKNYSGQPEVDKLFEGLNPNKYGGLVKAQDGLEFMKGWVSHRGFSQRLKTMGRTNPEVEQANMLNLLSQYKDKNYKDLLKEQGLGEWLRQHSSDGVSYSSYVNGKFGAHPSRVYVRGNKKDTESNRAHELTHMLENNGEWLTPEDQNKLTAPLGKPSFLKNIFNSGKSGRKYYGDPTEIHARMNQARMELGLTPDDKFTPEMFDQINKKKKWYGLKPFIKDKQSFINLMNTFAANDQFTSIDTAKYGSIIEDDMGQLKYPGLPTRIKSPSITMQGVPYPVEAQANTGQKVIMQPGQDYYFPGAEYVDEYPMIKRYQPGGPVFKIEEEDTSPFLKSFQGKSIPSVTEDYSAMSDFYNDLYAAGNKYTNKNTGLVSPFNAARAVLKATIKNPEVMFMKRYPLKNPQSNPYGVESYTTEEFSGKLHPWMPTDWAKPRREKPARFNSNKENRRLDRQIRKGIKNQGDCWGANCYEEEMPNVEYGGSMMQRGGTPIYVSDANDPRYKSYSDSLYSYNVGQRLNNILSADKNYVSVRGGSPLDRKIQEAARRTNRGLVDNTEGVSNKKVKEVMKEYQQKANKGILPVRYQGYIPNPDNSVTDLMTGRSFLEMVGLTEPRAAGNWYLPQWEKPQVQVVVDPNRAPKPKPSVREERHLMTPEDWKDVNSNDYGEEERKIKNADPTKYDIYRLPGNKFELVLKKKPAKKPVVVTKKTTPEPVRQEPKPVNVLQVTQPPVMNYNQGTPVYAPTPYGGNSGAGAFVGFKDKSGKITYVQPEDYERMGVPGYGREYIKSQTKQMYGGHIMMNGGPTKSHVNTVNRNYSSNKTGNSYQDYTTIIDEYPGKGNDTSYIFNQQTPRGNEQFFYSTNFGKPMVSLRRNGQFVTPISEQTADYRNIVLGGAGGFRKYGGAMMQIGGNIDLTSYGSRALVNQNGGNIDLNPYGSRAIVNRNGGDISLPNVYPGPFVSKYNYGGTPIEQTWDVIDKKYGGLIKAQNGIQTSGLAYPASSYIEDPYANYDWEGRMNKNVAAATDFWKNWYAKRATLPQFKDVSERRLKLLEEPINIEYLPSSEMLKEGMAGRYAIFGKNKGTFNFVNPTEKFHPISHDLSDFTSIRSQSTSLPVISHELFHKLHYEAPQGERNSYVGGSDFSSWNIPKSKRFISPRKSKMDRDEYSYMAGYSSILGNNSRQPSILKPKYPAQEKTVFNPEMETSLSHLRISENLDPTKTYTAEDVQPLIDKYRNLDEEYYLKKLDTLGPAEIQDEEGAVNARRINSMFKMLGNDPKKIAKFMNSVAAVDPKQSNQARYGGLTKAQKGLNIPGVTDYKPQRAVSDNTRIVQPIDNRNAGAVQSADQFTRDWMNSPMYNQMLQASIKASPKVDPLTKLPTADIPALREVAANPENRRVEFKDLNNPSLGGTTSFGLNRKGDPKNILNVIRLNINSEIPIEQSAGHEISGHQTTLGGNLIPYADVQKINKYFTPRNSIKIFDPIARWAKQGNISYDAAKKQIQDLRKDPSFNKEWTELENIRETTNSAIESRDHYISDPDETRSRLMSVRKTAKQNNVYNPFTQKMTKDNLRKLKGLNNDELNSLYENYTEDEILDMFNSISKTDQPGANQTMARYGGLFKAQDGGDSSAEQEWLNQQFVDNLTSDPAYYQWPGRIQDPKRRDQQVRDLFFSQIDQTKDPYLAERALKAANQGYGSDRTPNQKLKNYYGFDYADIDQDKLYKWFDEYKQEAEPFMGKRYGGAMMQKGGGFDEEAFQKFRQTLPLNLRMESPDYNLRGYWEALGKPLEFDYSQPKEEDGYYHAFSRNPQTGEILKRPQHPTFKMAIEEDRKFGAFPIVTPDGKIKTVSGRDYKAYGGPLVEYYKGKMTGPNIFKDGGQQKNKYFYNKGYGVPHFQKGGSKQTDLQQYYLGKIRTTRW